jgi:hypothetical protein
VVAESGGAQGFGEAAAVGAADLDHGAQFFGEQRLEQHVVEAALRESGRLSRPSTSFMY